MAGGLRHETPTSRRISLARKPFDYCRRGRSPTYATAGKGRVLTEAPIPKLGYLANDGPPDGTLAFAPHYLFHVSHCSF